MAAERNPRGALAAAVVCLMTFVVCCSSRILSDSNRVMTHNSLRLGRNSGTLRALSLRGGSGAPKMGDNGAVPLVRPMGGLRRTNSYSALNEILLTGEKSGHTGETETAPAEEPARQVGIASSSTIGRKSILKYLAIQSLNPISQMLSSKIFTSYAEHMLPCAASRSNPSPK